MKKDLFEKPIIRWCAPEYVYHEKSWLWFAVAGFVALAFVIYGLLTGGWTFSVAIIVLAGIYYLVYRDKPQIVDITISDVGVKIGRHIFPYNHLKIFWVVYDPPSVKRLYLRTTSRLHPDISVSLEETDPAELRRVLKIHLKESDATLEPMSDTLIRVFKL